MTLRYQQYGVAVLKSVSFRIAPGEKIGVVGRSGSGKTSLLSMYQGILCSSSIFVTAHLVNSAALLRMTEPSDGTILIDDVNTKTLNLGQMRGRM